MKHFLSHLLTPQSSNNYRAKLLHHSILFALAVLLLGSSFSVSYLKEKAVLGVSTSISIDQLLSFTNIQRQAYGLPSLEENQLLESAAAAKANDMFTKNYWAHYAPDGTSPWYFIQNSGYEYVYAGENLAKGFNSATDVVNAWMNSPTHRANVLSGNFQDVGFAVSEGTINGEYTTLVVEEFGGKLLVPPTTNQKTTGAGEPTQATQELKTEQKEAPVTKPVVDKQKDIQTQPAGAGILGLPFAIKTTVSQRFILLLIFMIISLFALDMILAHRRRIVRIAGHNLDHIILFGFIIFLTLYLFNGVIL